MSVDRLRFTVRGLMIASALVAIQLAAWGFILRGRLVLLLPVLVGFYVCGIITGFVAEGKARKPLEGFFLGVLFGPLGILFELVLPGRIPPPPGGWRSRV